MKREIYSNCVHFIVPCKKGDYFLLYEPIKMTELEEV